MQLHPKAMNDGGDLLRQMEPADSGEQQGYYSTTDMPTEMARTAMSEVGKSVICLCDCVVCVVVVVVFGAVGRWHFVSWVPWRFFLCVVWVCLACLLLWEGCVALVAVVWLGCAAVDVMMACVVLAVSGDVCVPVLGDRAGHCFNTTLATTLTPDPVPQ